MWYIYKYIYIYIYMYIRWQHLIDILQNDAACPHYIKGCKSNWKINFPRFRPRVACNAFDSLQAIINSMQTTVIRGRLFIIQFYRLSDGGGRAAGCGKTRPWFDVFELFDPFAIFLVQTGFRKHTSVEINWLDKENARGWRSLKIEALIANTITTAWVKGFDKDMTWPHGQCGQCGHLH